MKKLFTLLFLVFIATNSIWGQLKGTFTIGAVGNYTTLTAAVADLNSFGVDGPCTFYFIDNTYNESFIYLAPTGTSATNTITFKPATGVTATVNLTRTTNTGATGSVDGHFIIGTPTGVNSNLVSANYITIDGSNTVGGTTKDLSFIGAVTSSQISVFRIFGNNDHLTIKNCIVTLNSSSGSSIAPIQLTNYDASNKAPDYCTIENNTINATSGNGAAGVHISQSGSPTVGLTGLIIRNNIISARSRGMFISYTNDGNIYGNTISVTSQASQGASGMSLQTNFSTDGVFNVYNNKLISLTSLNNTAGAANGIIGIDNQCASPHVVNIYNNMVSGFNVSAATTNSKIYGIRASGSSTTYVYHNSVLLPEMTDMTAFGSSFIAGIVFASNATSEVAASGTMIVKNNVIRSNESTMKTWNIRRVGTSGTFTSDYNSVFRSNETNGFVGFFDASDAAAISDWQTASTQDASSKNVDINFTAANDLHLAGISVGDANLTGTAVGIMTDIDGDPRDVVAPYKGADEGLRVGVKGDIYVGNDSTGPGGTKPNFSTLKAAVDYLNDSPILGNVNCYITSDITELYTGSVGIGLAVNADPYTITFKPYTGVHPVITFNYPTDLNSGPSGAFVIGIPGKGNVTWDSLRTTKNIVIDGSNIVGGTTRDLTLQSATTAQRNGMPIVIAGEVSNVTIKNCNILHKAQAVSTSNLFISAIMIRSRNYLSKDWVPNHITFDNNHISSNFDGVPQNVQAIGTYQSGTPVPATFPNNITIKNNLLEGKRRAVVLYQAGSFDIFNNEVIINQNIAANTSNEAIYAVSVLAGSVVNIYNNKISKLSSMSTGAGFGNTGISLESNGTYNVYNNMITGFELTDANPTAYLTGIKNSSATDTLNCYFNTISLNNIAAIGTGAVAYKGLVISNGANTVKNNLVFSAEPDFASYCFSREGTAGTLTSNYNNLFAQDNTNGNVGYWDAAATKSLADWKTASSQDANSKSVTVNFVSMSDLHLTGASDGDVNLIGTPIAGLTKDIDGDLRNVTFPYVGADESNTPLPVELTSFAASSKGNVVELSWQTATEKNSSSFEVQRKSEKSEWTTVGKVQAAGTTTESKKYSFTEKDVKGTTVTYRLKMMDLDGSYSYSKEVEVKVDVPVNFELSQNYPNPFNPSTTIKYAIPTDSKVKLEIYSMLGELVTTLVNELQTTGNYSIAFDASRFASGAYIYRLTANNTVITKKMLLLK